MRLVTARAWCQDGLLLLGRVLLCLGMGWVIGGTLEACRGERQNHELVASLDSILLAREGKVARFIADVETRETLRIAALASRDSAVRVADRLAAAGASLRARDEVLREQLAAAVDRGGSPAGYAVLLPVVTARADTAEQWARSLRWALLEANDAFLGELEVNAILQQRIAVDSRPCIRAG
ncbi:MAG: hypothetical protein SFU84_05325 [Gemmatimonadales bacterium]|nr:hypothetical protein [Gemmatimonadales bacterium]